MTYVWNWDKIEFDFDKTVNTTSVNTMTFDTNVYYDKSFNLNGYLNFNAHVTGNTANLNLAAEAVGDAYNSDTLVEVDASVLTTSIYSGIELSVVSAVA